MFPNEVAVSVAKSYFIIKSVSLLPPPIYALLAFAIDEEYVTE